MEAEAFLLPDLDEGGFLGSMMMLEEATPEAAEEATTMAEELEEAVVDAEEEATPAAAPEPFFEAFEAEEEAHPSKELLLAAGGDASATEVAGEV